MKKIFISLLVFSIFTNTYAYEKIDCSTDTIFDEYSCHECFDGGQKSTGDFITFIDDIWVNNTTYDKIMFKEEQEMPIMYNLGNSEIIQNPAGDDFWEYTQELENLYYDDLGGYLLPPGQEVSWLKSGLGNAYEIRNNTNNVGENTAFLIFDLVAHSIIEGELSINDTPHRECVLYKSADTYEEEITEFIGEINGEITDIPTDEEEITEEPTPQDMTRVEAGPANFIFVILTSLILGSLMLSRRFKK